MSARSVSPSGIWRDWWFTFCALAMMLASDTKIRLKQGATATSGSLDIFILLEVGVYLAVGVYLLSRLGRHRLGRWPLSLILLTGYVFLMCVSVTYAVYPNYAAVRALQSALLVGLVLAVVATDNRAHFHRFAHGFLLLTVTLVGAGLVLPHEKGPLQADRFNWLAVHPVVVGLYSAIGVVLAAVYLAGYWRKRPGPQWSPLVYAGVLVVLLAALLASHTRGAVSAAAIACVIGVGMAVRRNRRVDTLAATFLAVAIAALAAGSTVIAYLERGEDADSLVTLNSRTDLWTQALEKIGQQPVFGFGVGATRGLFLADTGLGGGHNAVVNVAVDLGLLGLLVWLGLVLSVIIGFLRSRRFPLDRALGLALLATLGVNSLFYEGLGGPANVAAVWLAVLAGWSGELQRHREANRAGPPTPAANWRCTSEPETTREKQA